MYVNVIDENGGFFQWCVFVCVSELVVIKTDECIDNYIDVVYIEKGRGSFFLFFVSWGSI